ncbi:MAG: autotransporter outer membrane beta-barrel domain-containing protein [Candidatus Ochrobactrum gambitense]|nr:MAG: autotransporter outer membrane beta-barrel domain-containing protein [Candidatus Ochrobactrum gambitense]WEK15818.1 MAG: autotransporter outer membrane beta-barrel domain-containing protein [Candidatus Ochrobactrum gambitense]
MHSGVRGLTAAQLLSTTALFTVGVVLLHTGSAQAACSFSPTAGDDVFICDSGASAGGLTDTTGNNTLLLPEGGTGTVNGNVTFGAGTDRIEVHSGSIVGNVDQGSGADAFVITGGSVTGNVQQGAGIDDFQMTGGQIESLNQGDARDTFFMSGGRIVDAFEDGDYAVMTGGQIGRVDMKLDKNYFNMSGGIIDRNLVTGFDTDTIIISNGSIGGNISVSGGADSVTITGGTIGGNVLMSVGNDQFTWNGGGVVNGFVDLGGDDDVAVLANLTDANIGATPRITGGVGIDSLTFDNVVAGQVSRFDSWETVNLTNNTRLTFDAPFTLGDSGTGTGALNIDATSTILGGAAQSSIVPFTAGQLASVVNAGRIDLTSGGSSTTDSLTIIGNYAGQNGLLLIDTVLAGDGSPSDKLVIDSGAASGNTTIEVNNVGGAGARTATDGIMVVQALNGATTTAGAFALNEPLAAGAYQYYLFKGGVSANTAENWYLRSTIVQGITPTAPVVPTPVPLPAPGVAPPSADATPVEGDVINLYREEVPVYSALPPVAHHLALTTLGTFHERRGEQDLLESGGYLPSSWVRVLGQDVDMKWKGTVAPGVDGSLLGVQAGQDLFGYESASGHFDRFGVFFGYARATGDITGQALGWNDLAVGDMDVSGTSFGGYWTHIGPQGWYLDAVLMGTWFDGSVSSNAQQSIDVGGHGVTASLEGGYPVVLGGNWTLEPQAQLIWQHLSLDDQADSYSTVTFDTDNAWTGRVGMRLQGMQDTSFGKLRPYLKANLWQNFSSDQVVIFGTDPITTNLKGTSLEVGGGVTVDITEKASLFATADYTTNLGGERARIWEGNIGLNVKW